VSDFNRKTSKDWQSEGADGPSWCKKVKKPDKFTGLF
jgi:hypothetical protein